MALHDGNPFGVVRNWFSAGRDPAHPAFIAYKLGGGLVVRVGTPQWSRMLSTDTEVAAVTKSLWSLLSR